MTCSENSMIDWANVIIHGATLKKLCRIIAWNIRRVFHHLRFCLLLRQEDL